MNIQFEGAYNNALIVVNQDNIGSVLKSLITATHPTGYIVNHRHIAQLFKAVREESSSLKKKFDEEVRALLSNFISQRVRSHSFQTPEENNLIAGLHRGGASLGKYISAEQALRFSHYHVAFKASAFAGYPEHLGQAVSKDEVFSYAHSAVTDGVSTLVSSQYLPANIEYLRNLQETRDLLRGTFFSEVMDNAIIAGAADWARQGPYQADNVGRLIVQTSDPEIKELLRKGIAEGENNYRVNLAASSSLTFAALAK